MSKKLSPNKKNDSNFILRGPREFFKGILDGYEKVLNKYETNIGKPAFNYFTAEKGFGPELGTGLTGGFTGFALPEDVVVKDVSFPLGLVADVVLTFAAIAVLLTSSVDIALCISSNL